MARILVAEDDELVANTIQAMLRSGGHEVVLARRADEAIRGTAPARRALRAPPDSLCGL